MKITNMINPNIFREYDVRGVYPTELDEDVSYTFGKAYGTYIKKFHQTKCIVGHDNRLSSDSLTDALIKGILSTGIDVINLGLVTTPMYYYACILRNVPAGVMVTASHNPKDDNGFKFSFDERGNARGEMIQEFYQFLLTQNYDDGAGVMSFYDVKEKYYELLLSSVDIKHDRKLRVIIDCGNGTTSLFAPEIYNLIGVDLIVLYGESDAHFPNHHPDPAVEENLTVLKDAVVTLKADVGIAFDGDGDRVGIIDEKGTYIPADKFMIMISRDLIPTHENKRILYDVKCSKALTDEITRLGGVPVLCRTGNSYTKLATRDENCIFGGEFSGHLYFRDKFMQKKNNLFSAENANEGALELLFYLTLFISKKTPDFFAIDNIENGLNPRLCRFLMKKICELAVKNGKQVLITTHNPAILDGLNLNDDSQRLFVVTRNDEGKTQAKRIQTKEQTGDYRMMLSEMWMKGLIGGIPNNF